MTRSFHNLILPLFLAAAAALLGTPLQHETAHAQSPADVWMTVYPGNGEARLEWRLPTLSNQTGRWQYRVYDGTWGGWTNASGTASWNVTSYTADGLTNGNRHWFQVRFADGATVRAQSLEIPGTPYAPPAATPGTTRNLTAVPVRRVVKLSWTAPASGGTVTGYEVSRNGGTFQTIPGSTGSTTSHFVQGLRYNTVHSFRVRAVNHDGGRSPGGLVYDLFGAPSNSVTLAVIPPPSNFTVTPGDGQVTLSFRAPWTDGTHYTSNDYAHLLKADGQRYISPQLSISRQTSGNDFTFRATITGLTNGTTYSIRARMRYNIFEGTKVIATTSTVSAPVSVTPVSPGELEKPDLGIQPGDSQAVLSFGVDSPASLISKWQYNKDSAGWTDIAWTEYALFPTVPAKHRNRPGEFIVSGLTNGTQYSFQVRAVSATENGEASDSVTVTPIAPSQKPPKPMGLSATAGDTTVTLKWSDPPPLGNTVGTYQYKQGGSWADIPGSDHTTRSHVVTGLTNGTTYTFRIRGKNSGGTGPESDSVNAMPTAATAVPGAPGNFSPSPHHEHVVLKWTAPTTGGKVSSYEYRRRIGSTGDTWTPVPGGPNVTKHVVTGLTNGTNYKFTVRAKNAAGDGASSLEISARPFYATTKPGKPTNLKGVGGDQFVKFSWTLPAGNVRYIEYKLGSQWRRFPDGNGGMTSFTFRNGDVIDDRGQDYTVAITNGTKYTFRVRLNNGAGVGPQSDEVSATPYGPAKITPLAVPVFTAVAGNAQVTLNWRWTSTNLPGAYVKSWEYKQDSGNWTAVTDSDAGTRTYTVTGLTNDTAYTFRVRAVNSAGKGDASASVSATPKAGAGAGGASAGFSLTAVPGDGQVTLSWPANPDADGWELNQDDKGWNPISAAGSDGTVTYTVTGLSNGAAYSFQVREKNGESTSSSESNQISVVPAEGETAEDKTAQTGPTPAQLAARREMSAAESTAPEMARAIAGGTVDAVRRRIEQSSAGGGNVARMGGSETFTGLLTANGQMLADGNGAAVKQLLADSGFALQLEEASAQGSGGSGSWLSRLGFWGSGDYGSVSDESGALNLEGDALSFHVGADARLHRSVLAGVAMSWARSEITYKDGDRTGTHKLGLTGVHPYMGLAFGRVTVWGTGGYSWGDFDMGTAGGLLDGDTDVTLRTFGGGASGELLPSGVNSLRIKTEAMQARMNIKGVEGVSDLKTDVNRLRVSLEGSREWAFSGGSSLRPTIEAGYRRDGGDGRTGSGAEISGGLMFYAPAGLRIEARASTLLGREDRTQWGVSGQILWGDRKGAGLSFSLAPGYGAPGGNADEIWASRRFADRELVLQSPGARMEAAVGYGLRSGDRDIVTPYGEMTLGEFERSHRVGMRWLRSSVFSLRLQGERRELHGYGQDTEHIVMLHARLPE